MSTLSRHRKNRILSIIMISPQNHVESSNGVDFSILVVISPHVLVHFLKSTKAYNVKSSSTLFLDNILSNFEISFPCVRFNSLLGNNLIRKSWDHQKLDFHTPISRDWKNTLSCEIYVFEKLWIANLLNSKPIKMDEKIKHLYLQTF